MKIRKIISPLLILLYLSAVIGFSFYNCHCEHSDRLVLLTYDHCECAHEHNHLHGAQNLTQNTCNSTDCQHSAHVADESNCCSIVYKSIKIDQEDTFQKVASSHFIIAVLPVIDNIIEATNTVADYYKLYKTPPDEQKTPLIYQNCQLRL